MEATPGFRTWGVWPVLGTVVGVLFLNLLIVGLMLFLLVNVLLLERPRWKPWKWTTPWLFPREWREEA